jgi:hypothetical protein
MTLKYQEKVLQRAQREISIVMMSILKMNYLVYGGVVEDYGTLLRDALADGRSRLVV